MPKRGQVVVDEYLRRIVTGELNEGQLLPTETVMIEQFGISRTAVREAVQALAHKGFVRIRQGSGSTVAPQSSWNVLDPDYLAITGGGGQELAVHVMETGDILYPAIAAAAAQRADDAQIETLRGIVARMNDTKDLEQLAKLDSELHTAIALATGNAVLVSLHNSIAALAGKAETGDTPDPAVEQTATWSEYLVEAIASREPDAARETMRMHLRKLHR